MNKFFVCKIKKTSFLNHLKPSVAYLYPPTPPPPPENIKKPKGFLMFSGSISKQHQAVMG